MGDQLYEDGLRVFKDCWSSMQEHWRDFPVSSETKSQEWTSMLQSLKEEIHVLRINEIRKEIQSLWVQCYISEAERNRSIIFNKQANSEISLKKHREELHMLQRYYEENLELINLFKKYEETLNSLDSFQTQLPDERVRKNRGAVLLKEEQYRNLLKKVPKLQKTILKKINEKESEGFTFLIKDELFTDIVERDNNKYFQRKSLTQIPENVPTSKKSEPKRRFSADVSKCFK